MRSYVQFEPCSLCFDLWVSIFHQKRLPLDEIVQTHSAEQQKKSENKVPTFSCDDRLRISTGLSSKCQNVQHHTHIWCMITTYIFISKHMLSQLCVCGINGDHTEKVEFFKTIKLKQFK